MAEKEERSHKEQRIRSITHLYYSRPEILKAIFKFSEDREVSPRFYEGFGKRPDSFQYESDIYELVKRGATSFHCSEELWQDPLQIQTGMPEKQLNELRKGWDLLIDIDCKWIDFSKKAAQAVIKTLNDHGIKNVGIKFSGSKGFHILVPWKAFPKIINGVESKNLFPELPRKLVAFLRSESEKNLRKILPSDFAKQFSNTNLAKGTKCNQCREIASKRLVVKFICPRCNADEIRHLKTLTIPKLQCPKCRIDYQFLKKEYFFCENCKISSLTSPENFTLEEHDLYELMGLDMILVSPRHLFRMPYSLHEKTAMASIVLNEEELEKFQIPDANPLTIQPKDFMPDSQEDEAKEFVIKALEWYSENKPEDEIPYSEKNQNQNFQPIKIDNLSDKLFPPSIRKILEGVTDGRKRAAFILINYFRSIGMEKPELEKRVYEWNEKNEIPLKQGYIKSQIQWSYRNKIVPPPNFDKDYYKGIGIIPTEEELRFKNPVNFTVRKFQNEKNPENKPKKKFTKKKFVNKKSKSPKKDF